VTIAAAFLAACEAELAALKPGNVHVYAPGHGMTEADFRRSATAVAPGLCTTGAGLGRRVLDAVTATREVVGQNTNLGIILLCAPLAMAAESRPHDLRAALCRTLAASNVVDASLAFQAIALAAPGGLGDAARHDVRAPATVTLPEAMALAAHRDRIAYQYAHDFADVFEIGLRFFGAARIRWADAWAIAALYLRFLATFPDSHVQRRHGVAAAEAVQQEARRMEAAYTAAADPAALQPELLAWDARLKARGINPGTSADLTVATLFAHKLEDLAGRAR